MEMARILQGRKRAIQKRRYSFLIKEIKP